MDTTSKSYDIIVANGQVDRLGLEPGVYPFVTYTPNQIYLND